MVVNEMGGIVGCILVTLSGDFDTIMDISLLAEYQGFGFGKLLLQETLKELENIA